MAAAINNDSDTSPVLNKNESNSVNNLPEISPASISEKSSAAEVSSAFGGFGIDELYTLALHFHKEKEGKAFHLTYPDKLTLIAYSQQVSKGPFQESKASPLGYLDVIGRDRRKTWQSLGNMSQIDAKLNFIKLLHKVSPLFQPFVLAHKCHLEEEKKRKEEEQKLREEEETLRLEEEKNYIEEEKKKNEKEILRQNHQKRLIQEALNRQTFHQFKAYAEKQYPGDPEQQAVLIRQLQEQHYQQYMQQVLQEQLTAPTRNSTSSTKEDPPQQNCEQMNNNPVNMMSEMENPHDGTQDSSNEASEEEIADPLSIPAPNMWTRKDIVEFKESIRKDGGDGIIKVGHGETVTVRVPTCSDGTCLVWEFATDNYDIGFGVYFEWTKSPDAAVTVHISESEDEENDDDDDDIYPISNDIEKGMALSDRPPISSIVPIYRRDCHEDVYAGSHVYPGQGVYLLKFDNSYSLWRSKTLYYRVYYTR